MRKAQAAMEYLMTYGWAILIVVVVVAALFALGVFTPGASRVPCSPCFSAGDFTYVDYSQGPLKVTDGSLTLRTGPRDITLTAVKIIVGSTTTTLVSGTDYPSALLTSGTTVQITGIPDAAASTDAMSITYTVQSSTLSHTDSATIHNQ